MAKTVTNVLVGVATLYYHPTVGTAAASITTEVGYTEDGVNFEYTPTVEDILVEEETMAINRVITKEEVSIVCNMAESDMNNLELAMAGASRAADVITLGGGALQDFAIRIVGDNPNGAGKRTIYAGYVHPVGTVGQSYKKGSKTIVPVTFKAYKYDESASAVTITDVA